MNNYPVVLAEDLAQRVGRADAPLLLDVRRRVAFEASLHMVAGARWRDPDRLDAWVGDFVPASEVLVYCAHGHNVSQMVAAALRVRGVRARVLAGGIEAWMEAGGVTLLRAALPAGGESGGSRWVTRERPEIDRLACAWLVRRFIDASAEFHHVAADCVQAVAAEIGGLPFDVPGVTLSHVGEHCSFDAFIDRFGLADPALRHLARIVRAADTARPDLAPQAAGLLAVSLGLSTLHDDDLAALEQAMAVYDALYAWCRDAREQSHDRPPATQGGTVA